MRYLITVFIILTGCNGGVLPVFDAGDAGPDPVADAGPIVWDAGDVDAGAKPVDAGPQSTWFQFPMLPPDVAHTSAGAYADGVSRMQHDDVWTGTRVTAVDSVSYADVSFTVVHNDVCVGVPMHIHIMLNGVAIGDTGLTEATGTVVVHLDFPPVDGPTYDITYTIDAGACGQIGVAALEPTNTITLGTP